MAVKYQVFVSSTYSDLEEERRRVIQGILEMGHIPVGMEMFSAGDDEQWKIIASHIEQSDYYIVILAHRYGSRVGSISYTRREYEYALSQGIPIIGFVVDDNAHWPADRVDRSPRDVADLASFRTLVQEKPVGFWSSASDLYGKATVALMKAITGNPRTGWVPASSALGPDVTAEITRLSAENARLRSDLATARRDDEEGKQSRLRELYARLWKSDQQYSIRFFGDTAWSPSTNLNLAVIYWFFAPTMLVEASKADLGNLLAISSVPPNIQGRPAETVPMNNLSSILGNLMTHELVEPSSRRHPVADTNEYWTLTVLGKELFTYLTRKKLEEATTASGAEESAGNS